ncbi:MAG: MMPL family transporter, partial [Thermoleophilia bacterium]|nr:MMPL family transporter [Thermoleophilia bacterium]
MSLLLYRISHLCTRHRRVVAAVWIVLLFAVGFLVATVGGKTSDDLTLPGTGSTEATDLLDRYLPEQANGTNPLALEVEGGKLTDGANSKAIERTVRAYEREPGVLDVVSPLSDRGADALSKDERIGYISLTIRAGPDTLTDDRAEALIDVSAPASDAGIEVSAGGYLGQQVSQPETHSSEVVGIAAAIVILLFTFGTAVAMAMPITTAILGLVISLCAIALAGHAIEIPTVAPTLATMIGLGVGIDYALFIVTRHRSHLAAGMEPEESIARAAATSGSAVAFAGGTVVIALLSLTLADIPIVSALGYSAAIAVVVAVCCALTLLPALLAMLGPRIESWPIPKLHRPEHRDHHSHGFERLARFVGRHPWSTGTIAAAVLVALALPALDMRLGQQDYGQFPTSTEARQSYDTLSRGFGPGVNGPFLIAVSFDPKAHNDQQGLNELERQQDQEQQQATEQANAIATQLV